MRALEKLTAIEAVRLIARREITSEALVRACLDRILVRDSEVQAWVHVDAERALAWARKSDLAGASGMLSGIPIAVKDVIDTADMPTQYNSAIYHGHRPSADAACVALARREGCGARYWAACITSAHSPCQRLASNRHGRRRPRARPANICALQNCPGLGSGCSRQHPSPWRSILVY